MSIRKAGEWGPEQWDLNKVHSRVTFDKSKAVQRAKGRSLSNKNNCLATKTSIFEVAIHSIKITRL